MIMDEEFPLFLFTALVTEPPAEDSGWRRRCQQRRRRRRGSVSEPNTPKLIHDIAPARATHQIGSRQPCPPCTPPKTCGRPHRAMPPRGPAPARAHCRPSCSFAPIFGPEQTRPPTLGNVPGHPAVPVGDGIPPAVPGLQIVLCHRCFTAGGQHKQAPPLTRAQNFKAENLARHPG